MNKFRELKYAIIICKIKGNNNEQRGTCDWNNYNLIN